MTEPIYCATCKTALNRFLDREGGSALSYFHSLQNGPVDHEPVPVPLSQLDNPIMRCDFDSAPDPVWLYTAAEQVTEASVVTRSKVGLRDYQQRHTAARVRSVETAHALTSNLGEGWTACEACAELIEARDLLGLVRRVTEAMPPQMVRGRKLIEKRGELIDMYGRLFDTLLPGRERIGGEPDVVA